MVECTVLPPRVLYIPLLPIKMNGKLCFPLCRKCAETSNQEKCVHTDAERALRSVWCTLELHKSLGLGYKVHEIWHWSEKSNTLSEHMKCFAKQK